jgi:hypothetical protein
MYEFSVTGIGPVAVGTGVLAAFSDPFCAARPVAAPIESTATHISLIPTLVLFISSSCANSLPDGTGMDSVHFVGRTP